MEIYKRHRPHTLMDIVGQDCVVKALLEMKRKGKIPHTILLSGPSGTGKTSTARILKEELDCSDHDFNEMNCADVRGIENVREIRSHMGMSPMGGKCRIWLIDEAHKLTTDAQNALLKMLEDTPAHVYFFLATTEPAKLLPTVRSRCTELKFKLLSDPSLKDIVRSVSAEEAIELDDRVLDEIVTSAAGNARKALVILEHASRVASKADQLEVVEGSTKNEAFALCQTLVKPKPKWADVAKILSTIEGEPEGLRQMVLSYFHKVITGSNPRSHAQAAVVLENFCRKQFFAKAELSLACWQTCWDLNSSKG